MVSRPRETLAASTRTVTRSRFPHWLRFSVSPDQYLSGPNYSPAECRKNLKAPLNRVARLSSSVSTVCGALLSVGPLSPGPRVSFRLLLPGGRHPFRFPFCLPPLTACEQHSSQSTRPSDRPSQPVIPNEDFSSGLYSISTGTNRFFLFPVDFRGIGEHGDARFGLRALLTRRCELQCVRGPFSCIVSIFLW